MATEKNRARTGPARRPGFRAVTLGQVAARAGVSVATVSGVLNDSAFCFASDKTREKVKQVARDLGYYPNLVYRGIRKRRTGLLGLVLPNITVHAMAVFVDAVERGAREHGCQLLIGYSHDEIAAEEKILHDFVSRRVDGIIFVPGCARGKRDELARIAANGFPLVLSGRFLSEFAGFDAVIYDGARGGALAAEHLLGLGHRYLGVLKGPVYHPPRFCRIAGFQAAARRGGAAVDTIPLGKAFSSWEMTRAGYRVIKRRYAAGLPVPTALFTASDSVALGVMKALVEQRLAIPGDVSVVGFDDIPDASFFPVSLTTIARPSRRLGERAIHLLLRRIEGDGGTPVREVTPVKLAVRDSTGPPPPGAPEKAAARPDRGGCHG